MTTIRDCTTTRRPLPAIDKRMELINRLSHLRNQMDDLQALVYKIDETQRDGRVSLDIAAMWSDSAQAAIRCMEAALNGGRS